VHGAWPFGDGMVGSDLERFRLGKRRLEGALQQQIGRRAQILLLTKVHLYKQILFCFAERSLLAMKATSGVHKTARVYPLSFDDGSFTHPRSRIQLGRAVDSANIPQSS